MDLIQKTNSEVHRIYRLYFRFVLLYRQTSLNFNVRGV